MDANEGPLTGRQTYTLSLNAKEEGRDLLWPEIHENFVQNGLFIASKGKN